MSKFSLHLDTDNAAFDDDVGYEVARILRDIADKVERDGEDACLPIMDINGNRIGNADFFTN